MINDQVNPSGWSLLSKKLAEEKGDHWCVALSPISYRKKSLLLSKCVYTLSETNIHTPINNWQNFVKCKSSQ